MLLKACNVDGCKKLYYSRDYCRLHYDKHRRHGDPLFIRKIQGVCVFTGCGKQSKSKNLCPTHHMKWLRTGTLQYQRHWDGKAKERSNISCQAWKKKNWSYYKAYLLSRKSHLRRVTPKWADKKMIIKFYQDKPEGFHVDHIIPIHGKKVSGLHVIENLQYLPAVKNMSKGNKFVDDESLSLRMSGRFSLSRSGDIRDRKSTLPA